jgi:anti-sigma factor RsiW
MMTHYDRDTLTDYLHGALEPDADAAVFAHLEACTSCTAVYGDEAALGEALRSAARAEELEFPSLVKARVWDAVRHQKPSWIDQLRAWGPKVALPVAAAIAIAAYLGAPALHPLPAAGVEASYFLDEHNAAAQQNPFGPGVAPAIYTPDRSGTSSAASYIDTAEAATLDDATGAVR